MTRSLQALMIALGASAVVIGLAIVLAGGAATAHFTDGLFASLAGGTTPARGSFGPTVESEFGFYAPLWIAYGALLVATAMSLPRTLDRVQVLAAVFFAGGLGRALAWWRSGPPHPAFVLLMVIELTLPAAFIALWAAARKGRAKMG